MSVSSSTARVQYTLSSGAQALPVTFYFLENSHVQALVDRSGVPLTLVENTDYTLTGAGNTSGGTLTTIAGTAANLVATDVVTIRRNITITQLVNYVYNDSFPAETHEQALDKLTMIAQYLNEVLERTLKLPATEPAGFDASIPDVDTRANGVLTFDDTGDATVISKQELIDDLSLLDPSVTIGTAGKALLAIESVATDKVLGRSTAGTGNFELLACTAAGRAILAAASVSAQRALLEFPLFARCGTQFDMTTTTFGDVTDMSVNVVAGTYDFEVILQITANATGASKWQLAGTATVSSMTGAYDVPGQSSNYDVGLISTFPGGGSSSTNVTTVVATLKGTMVVSGAGTVKVQAAQASASGTSSVLVGSFMKLTRHF